MATSSIKKVQQRIFGTGVESKATQDDEGHDSSQISNASAAGQTPSSGLTLVIPTPKSAPSLPRKVGSDQSRKAAIVDSGGDASEENKVPGAEAEEGYDKEEGNEPYRVRLAKKLGAEYKGTERYRLQEDDQKEGHWKRWGPYLSDRQWVSLTLYL
jgi:hypothetical protein